MPWKACNPMDERLKFIARLLVGEKMGPALSCTARGTVSEGRRTFVSRLAASGEKERSRDTCEGHEGHG
jgi:hypothetical protein